MPLLDNDGISSMSAWPSAAIRRLAIHVDDWCGDIYRHDVFREPCWFSRLLTGCIFPRRPERCALAAEVSISRLDELWSFFWHLSGARQAEQFIINVK